MTNIQLISLCIKNDRTGQKELYAQYSRQMYSICLRYCKRPDVAADAMQRGFINVFKNIKHYSNNGSLGGWIRRIIVNESLKQLNIEKKHFSSDIETVPLDSFTESINFNFDQFNYQRLIQLLDQLPLGYRTVFSMFVLDEMPHHEIASSLNISENSSRTQLYKARKKLQNLILKDEHLSSEYPQEIKSTAS